MAVCLLSLLRRTLPRALSSTCAHAHMRTCTPAQRHSEPMRPRVARSCRVRVPPAPSALRQKWRCSCGRTGTGLSLNSPPRAPGARGHRQRQVRQIPPQLQGPRGVARRHPRCSRPRRRTLLRTRRSAARADRHVRQARGVVLRRTPTCAAACSTRQRRESALAPLAQLREVTLARVRESRPRPRPEWARSWSYGLGLGCASARRGPGYAGEAQGSRGTGRARRQDSGEARWRSPLASWRDRVLSVVGGQERT